MAMYLTGTLDTRKLAMAPSANPTAEASGILLNQSRRIAFNRHADGCSLAVGALESDDGTLPLATVARQGTQFVLSAPSYSFLTLYFFTAGHEFHWSTSLGAMARAAGSKTANAAFESFGLKYQIWPGNETVYAGVKKLNPGQQVTVEAGLQRFGTAPQAAAKAPNVDPEDSTAVHELLHETLAAALDKLAPAHGTTGVMLGGFDSALIVALLAELGRPVHAVTLGYENGKYNQAHISDLQKRYGFKHDWVRIEPELMREGLLRYGELFDQPVTQPHYLVSSLQLAKVLVENGALTALTGDGCDGVFFGYPTVFRKARAVRLLRRIPKVTKRALRRALGTPRVERLMGQPARLARQLLEVTSRPDHLQSFLTAMAVDETSARSAVDGDPMTPDFEREQLESLYQANVAGKSWVDITYISKNMVGLNRAKLASVWNHSGLEKIYSPYMMPAVTAMAKAIPKNYWLSDETPSGKYMLTQMALEHGLLSEDIVYQKKMSPVASPMDNWLRHELREDVLRMIGEHPILKADYCEELLRKRRVEEWYKRRVTIDDYASQALGMLLSYSRMVGIREEPELGPEASR